MRVWGVYVHSCTCESVCTHRWQGWAWGWLDKKRQLSGHLTLRSLILSWTWFIWLAAGGGELEIALKAGITALPGEGKSDWRGHLDKVSKETWSCFFVASIRLEGKINVIIFVEDKMLNEGLVLFEMNADHPPPSLACVWGRCSHLLGSSSRWRAWAAVEVLQALYIVCPDLETRPVFFPVLPSLVLLSKWPLCLLPFQPERDTPVSGALRSKAPVTCPSKDTQESCSKRRLTLTSALLCCSITGKWHS